MKKLLRILLVSVILLASAAGSVMAQGPGNGIHNPEDILNDYPVSELSEKQIADNVI